MQQLCHSSTINNSNRLQKNPGAGSDGGVKSAELIHAPAGSQDWSALDHACRRLCHGLGMPAELTPWPTISRKPNGTDSSANRRRLRATALMLAGAGHGPLRRSSQHARAIPFPEAGTRVRSAADPREPGPRVERRRRRLPASAHRSGWVSENFTFITSISRAGTGRGRAWPVGPAAEAAAGPPPRDPVGDVADGPAVEAPVWARAGDGRSAEQA